jgi:hypothetical protein
MDAAWPPASRISRSTVLMVEDGEFGSGGNGVVLLASEVVFAASITAGVLLIILFFFVLHPSS